MDYFLEYIKLTSEIKELPKEEKIRIESIIYYLLDGKYSIFKRVNKPSLESIKKELQAKIKEYNINIISPIRCKSIYETILNPRTQNIYRTIDMLYEELNKIYLSAGAPERMVEMGYGRNYLRRKKDKKMAAQLRKEIAAKRIELMVIKVFAQIINEAAEWEDPSEHVNTAAIFGII